MRQTTAHLPSLIVFRRMLACCLLLSSVALPLQAWAVDMDGDGYDDAVDAFSADPLAWKDTDGDGMPDAVKGYFHDNFTGGPRPEWVGIKAPEASVGWMYLTQNPDRLSIKSGYGGAAPYQKVSITMAVPAGGATLTFTTVGNPYHPRTKLNGVSDCVAPDYCFFPIKTWNLSSGTQTISWEMICGTSFFFVCEGVAIDNVLVKPNATTLVEDIDDDNDGVLDVTDKFPLDPIESVDTDNDGIGNNADLDDDNDGIPDYIDADPLNAATSTEKLFPMNGGYKGSSISESQAVQ